MQKRVIFGHLWDWMNFFGCELKFSKPKIFPRKSLGPVFYLDLKKGKIAIFQNFAKIPRERQVGEKIEKIFFFFKVLYLLYTPHKYRRHWSNRHQPRRDDIFCDKNCLFLAKFCYFLVFFP